MNKLKHKKAFTLIEILIVIAIIGILAVVVVMALAQSAKEKARIAQAQRFSDSMRAAMEEGVYGNNVPGSYWRFNTITGGVTPDEWGNSAASCIGSGCPSIVDGIIGKAFNFDGINDVVNIPHNDALMPSTNITIEVMAKYYGGGGAFVQKDTSWAQGYHLGIYGGVIRWSINGPDRPAVGSVAAITDKWTHIVGTYDGSTMNLYYDGVFQDDYVYSSSIGSNTDPVQIGYGDYTGSYMNADIDYVRIYSETLTVQQIQQRYVESVPKYRMTLK